MERRALLTCVVLLIVLVCPTAIRAQDLVKDALASFPPQTIRVEYSNPAKLRTLPSYASLRQRYVGPRLQVLEELLSQLGIRESDTDQLVLGWQRGAREGEMELDGLAAGRFDASSIAEHAAARGMPPASVAGLPAYCFKPEEGATCVVILGKSLGAFGTLGSLSAMLEIRDGRAASLSSDDRFMKLMSEAHTQAPIWGVGVGPAVADWLKAWMPSQKDLQLDWSRAFQTVEALAYSVEAGDKVRLDVMFYCTTPEAAVNLRQVLEGLRLFQQLAWQNQNPNRPNPFETLGVEVNGRRVFLKLTTAYSELERAGTFSAP